MFGIILPPGLDCVRVMAATGRQGKRPCLWEGHPDVPQHEIEASIDSDLRVRRWLTKQGVIKNGLATLNLTIECFSQGKNGRPFRRQERDAVHPLRQEEAARRLG